MPVAGDDQLDLCGDGAGNHLVIVGIIGHHARHGRGLHQFHRLQIIGQYLGSLPDYTYDPYGGSSNDAPAQGDANAFQYTGRENDGVAGLYFYRARYYKPAWGRFISQDSIGLQGGPNLYAYVGGDPISEVDPFGLAKRKDPYSDINTRPGPTDQSGRQTRANPIEGPHSKPPDLKDKIAERAVDKIVKMITGVADIVTRNPITVCVSLMKLRDIACGEGEACVK